MCPYAAPPSQSLKQRVFTCLTKLSDRDTQSQAANELKSIAKTIDPNSVPVFLSCIHSTDASDKSPVRRQCVHILEILSQTHGNVLSPYLSKILSNIIRRLRDPDTSVRSACVHSVSALATHITKPPFATFLKPLTEALFTEQDPNSQIGAALCLASVIDTVPDPEPARLAKWLPKFEKLLKCQNFKAKPALLALIGSVISAGGASGEGALRNLVPCVVEFLSSEDWAARKAAAEALLKLVLVERDVLSEFKNGCLKVFESRRFDKVKVVREVMNRLLEAWKQVPDVSEEVSPPPRSSTSSKENVSDGRYPPGSKSYRNYAFQSPHSQRKPKPAVRLTPPGSSSASNAWGRSHLKNTEGRASSSLSQKPVRNRHLDWNVEVAVPNVTSSMAARGLKLQERDTNIPQRDNNEKYGLLKPKTESSLFGKSDKMHRVSGVKNGSSRVVSCDGETQDSILPVSDVTENIHMKNSESEEVSLIRDQLVQIEKQQSSLLDLMQKFIGTSQNGMWALETRVHGLELALDDISYDLAISSGRMSKPSTRQNACFSLPGAEFLSSKFWRRTQSRYSTARFSTSNANHSAAAALSRFENDAGAETSELPPRRFLRPTVGGFIMNPLAEIRSDSRGIRNEA